MSTDKPLRNIQKENKSQKGIMFQDPSSVQAEDNKDCDAASESMIQVADHKACCRNNPNLIPDSNPHTDVVLIGEEGNVGKSGEDEKQTSRLHI